MASVSVNVPGPGSATALAAGFAALGAGLSSNFEIAELLVLTAWIFGFITLLIEFGPKIWKSLSNSDSSN